MTDAADVPDRLKNALADRYELLDQLGEGGMATVYLAQDLKHNRKVAVKVLKPELAAVVGADRFLTEIETTANLQHPHILALYDSGEADSFLFYVMPYVEGETLGQRLARERQLPVDEAVRIATDMAEALDYAHRAGVIHRDIKPANVLMQEGRPLIADFGIALAVGAAGGARLTETGLSVGTPYYMSPEQATGDQVIGAAADTYSLGCVLYEMLVGEPPYPGATAQAVLGKIIAGDPVSATRVRSSIPRNVDAAIQKALERLPADRFTSTKDFGAALADPGFRHGGMDASVVGEAVGVWKTRTYATGAMAAVAILVALAGWLKPAPVPMPDPVLRYSLPLPAGDGLFQMPQVRVALSPDGQTLVYAGNPEGGGAPRLYVRPRNQLRGTPLGPEGPVGNPTFSPDGTRIAYVGFPLSINVISLGGAPPVTVADSGFDAGSLSWGPDGYIYGDADRTEGALSDGIARVPEGGGSPELVSTPDTTRGEHWHHQPDALPNGKGVLFTIGRGSDRVEDEIGVVDLATGEHEALLTGVFARYSRSGHLVYVTAEGTLLAAPFDQESLSLTGDPVAVVQGVRVPVNGRVDLVVSSNGTLMYSTGPATGGNEHELAWVTREGQGAAVDPGWTFNPGDANHGLALSPEADRVALRIQTDAGSDIWIKELPGGPLSRLTFHEAPERMPRWSNDGERVTFLSAREGDYDVWTKQADGTGEPELIYDHDVFLAQGFWSPDGDWLLVRTGGVANVEGGRDILALQPGTDGPPMSLLATQFDEWGPAFSRDGRWIAYQSTETGENEVFVRPFPDVESGKWQVSSGGGQSPLWSHGGTELFYWTSVGELVSVDVETDGRFRAGERRVLFDINGAEYRIPGVSGQYDISPDDERFLMLRRAGTDDEATNELIVVENWFEELVGAGAGR
jgi:serine/threonine-protein kinase